MNYGFTITASGWRLLARILAGQPVSFTRVMVGKGKVPPGVNPADLTDLVAPVAGATSTVPLVDNRTVSFVVEYRSDLGGGLEEGFWLNEFGIFARDPNNPEEREVLLYYATLGDYPQYVAPCAGGSVDIRRFPVSLVLTDDLKVIIEYPPLAFMTAGDVSKYVTVTVVPLLRDEAAKLIALHNASGEAHPDIRAWIRRLEDMLLSNITKNPFLIDFSDLDGLIVEGVWNKPMKRMEF